MIQDQQVRISQGSTGETDAARKIACCCKRGRAITIELRSNLSLS